jgi:hypothetical protein
MFSNRNYSDTSAFTVERYKDIVGAILDALPQSDRTTITESRDFQTIQQEIHRKRLDTALSPNDKKLINQFQPLPGTLNDFVRFFEQNVQPHKPPMEPLWGLIYLNLKVISL